MIIFEIYIMYIISILFPQISDLRRCLEEK